MAEMQPFLIIGNGIAGVTAAEILRNEDATAEITVIADDPFPVYYRPALKDYLGGKLREDKLWARPISFYQNRRIRFLHDRVVGIQAGQHCVRLSGGQTIGYSRLLLAHGARARSLTCSGSDLAGVTALRTVADYQRVLSRLNSNSVRRIVVTGSGTLALESIETLRHRGFQLTHLLRRHSLWSEVLDSTASDLVLQQEKRDGVDIRYEQEIAEIVGKDGQVTGIITTTDVHIPCELILIGIGIEPNIDFVAAAGIACGGGVKVDGAMRTNVPDIYAAGDLVESTDPLTGRARVIGQWYPSIQQARAAAYSMLDLLDARHQFRFGNFYNGTFLYGLDFASAGFTNIPKNGKGYQEIVADPKPRTYQKAILKDGIAVGVIALGNRKGALTFKRAIDAGVNLSPVASRLFAPDFKFSEWLDAQGVPGPVLGVSREGAVAVKKAAYAGVGSRSALLKPHAMAEAILVPAGPGEIKDALKETYLSQTRVVTIGRNEGAVLPINYSSISRRHAEISYANGQYILCDLESKYGTFVNDHRLEPGSIHSLKPGDKVSFGKVTFVFQIRQVDVSASVLLRKPDMGGLLANNPNKQPGRDAANGDQAVQKHRNDILVTTTPPEKASAGSQASPGQPTLNADGTLQLPGAKNAIPATRVAIMRNMPALIALMHETPEVFLLKQGERYVLGRDIAASQIMLADMSVSRKHAEIFPGPDSYYIRDLGSSNGVRVNQTRIDNPYRLSNGDSIMAGNVPLYFIDLSNDTHTVSPQQTFNSEGRTEPVSPGVCRGCGSESSSIARFCPKCGMPL